MKGDQLDPRCLRRGDRVEVATSSRGVVVGTFGNAFEGSDVGLLIKGELGEFSVPFDDDEDFERTWRLVERPAELGSLWRDPEGRRWVHVGGDAWVIVGDGAALGIGRGQDAAIAALTPVTVNDDEVPF